MGEGWKIGRVCINPPNNLAVDILISLSPLPLPTLPLNPEDRSGAFMSGEVGKSGRKKQRPHMGSKAGLYPGLPFSCRIVFKVGSKRKRQVFGL